MIIIIINKYELAWWLCFGLLSGWSQVQTLMAWSRLYIFLLKGYFRGKERVLAVLLIGFWEENEFWDCEKRSECYWEKTWEKGLGYLGNWRRTLKGYQFVQGSQVRGRCPYVYINYALWIWVLYSQLNSVWHEFRNICTMIENWLVWCWV